MLSEDFAVVDASSNFSTATTGKLSLALEELKRTVKALDNDRIYKALAVADTTWKFNPPYGPHFGGVWERLIQSAKRTLLLILGSRRLSFDTLLTIMGETESILNSRLLTNVAEQPNNEEPLTF